MQKSYFPAMHKVVSATNVSKKFGNFFALQNFSFQLRPGESCGLLGPNGAGKSTLINILYGAADRTDGSIAVFGLDPRVNGREIRKRLGVVTQDNALDDSLTVLENMNLYAAFVGVPKADRATRISELLDFMLLAHKINDPIRTLSGGMKRRLVFVRALLANPELVILDEPTTGLDPAVRHLLWGKVKELKAQGKTVLLTTHYMHEAEVLCDRILIVNSGSIVAEGTPVELIKKHAPGFVAVLDPEASHLQAALDVLKKNECEVQSDASGIYIRSTNYEYLADLQKQHTKDVLQLRPANLEDVFLKITGKELSSDA